MCLQSPRFFASTEMPNLGLQGRWQLPLGGLGSFLLPLPSKPPPPRACPHGGCWALCRCNHLSGAALASRTTDTSPTSHPRTAGSAWLGPTHVPVTLPSVCDYRTTAPRDPPPHQKSVLREVLVHTDGLFCPKARWVPWPSTSPSDPSDSPV